MNRLFAKCIEAIKQSHFFRVANAAQTLICLVNGIFSRTTVIGQTSNLIDILVGKENLDELMHDLISVSHKTLIHVTPIRLKSIIVNLLLSLASV